MLRSLCSAGFERGSDWAAITGRPAVPAVGRPGLELPTITSAVGCITVRPLLDLTVSVLPLLEAKWATEKTQSVCFCLPACLPD